MTNLFILASAGGGGSGGGGGGGGILVLPFVLIAAFAAWWARRKQIQKATKALVNARQADPSWNDVTTRATDVFYAFQQDWSDFNEQAMTAYLTPYYFEHVKLILKAMRLLHRQNRMTNVIVANAIVFNVNDETQNSLDNFDIEITADVKDEIVDTDTGVVLFTNPTVLTEVWHFKRQSELWMLDGIGQASAEKMIEKGHDYNTVSGSSDDTSIKLLNFATKNNFYYNIDFGFLLMPTDGVLFSAAGFGKSDINYHVIGEYRGVLVQFFQYIPFKDNGQRKVSDLWAWLYRPSYAGKPCIVAQATLPKSYGNISIRHRDSGGIQLVKPPGMQRVSLEGVDFDKDFVVYATDANEIPSLELLNPGFMSKLLQAPFQVNIEIVGNSLYFYSDTKVYDYDTLLALLENAFQEMKM